MLFRSIIFLPHNFYSNLPQLTEMIYLLLGSDAAAKMFHWCCGVLAALAVFAVGAKLWSRRIGITAAALFYCLPFVQDLSQTARIDLATTFFATLAFAAVLQANDGDRWVWLAGMLTGAAVATKWTAIPVVLIAASAGILLARRPVFMFGLFVVLFVAPWLFKNWLLAGNPIYPLHSASPHWTAEQAATFERVHYGTAKLKPLFERAWHYSFKEHGAVPTLLMIAPLAWLVPGNNRLRRALWLLVVAYVGWYALTFRPWRFIFPVAPLAALAGACALDSVAKWSRPAIVAQ